MKDKIEIKWPWEMVWMEYVDDCIDLIKALLPPDHELQDHELFPGIKWHGRSVFIVDDDTTGEFLRIDCEDMKRGRKPGEKVPTITAIRTRQEVSFLIERDHQAEMCK
jgi:hypothetical protein